MNKIISTAISYGSALVIGSAVGALVALERPTAPQRLERVESQVEETKEQDNHPTTEVKPELPSTKNEEKPVRKEEKPQEKPATSAEKKITPKSVLAAQPPSVPKTETAIYTYEDYEKAILGTCPSERDKSNSWEEGNRLNAIGIITSGESKTSPMNSLNALIESWWNEYKLGKWVGRHMMASLNHVAGFDNTWANSRIGFFIEWEGLFITWDNSWEDGETINATTEQMQYLDHLVSDGTNYLRWLDSTYSAKCPND